MHRILAKVSLFVLTSINFGLVITILRGADIGEEAEMHRILARIAAMYETGGPGLPRQARPARARTHTHTHEHTRTHALARTRARARTPRRVFFSLVGTCLLPCHARARARARAHTYVPKCLPFLPPPPTPPLRARLSQVAAAAAMYNEAAAEAEEHLKAKLAQK